MMSALSPLTRRVLAVALLGSVLLAIEALVVTPWLEQRAFYRQRIAEDRALLARFDTVALQQRSILAALTRLEETGGSPDRFLTAAADAVAAAELQGLVKSAAAAEGVAVTSTQVLATDTNQRFRSVAVTVQATAELDALVRLVHRLESGSPSVRLRALEIQAGGRENSRQLAVRMDAYGLLPETKS